MSATEQPLQSQEPTGWQRFLPAVIWLRAYRPGDLPADLLAGLLVTVLLVPQAMAYALLAELPPRVGLYASIAPPLLYALFGASRYIAIGPVALVSLLVADVTAGAAASAEVESTQVVLVLAALVGVLLVLLGVLCLGSIVNFISDPVLTGFTSAAALLIATSQVRNFLGLEIERGSFIQTLGAVWQNIDQVNGVTATIGVSALLVLLLAGAPLEALLQRWALSERLQIVVTKVPPLLLVALSTWLTAALSLHERFGVAIVGELGAGLPPLTLPPLRPGLWWSLLPGALTIALISFVTTMAVANSLAGRRRQQIEPSQEAAALGASNLAAAFTGGYPVSASISRSALTLDAGARTPAAAATSALLVLLTVVFLGPLVHFLPKAMLAALIMSAVFGLFDAPKWVSVWRYSHLEGIALLVTFVSTLLLGVDQGIAIGAAVGLLIYLWRTSRPRIVVEGRLNGSAHFRSQAQDEVDSVADPLLVVRIDQDIYFANTGYCEERILRAVAERPHVQHLLLDFKSVNSIDASGYDMLKRLTESLTDAGVTVHLAAVKQPIYELLHTNGLSEWLDDSHIFTTADEGVEQLTDAAQHESEDRPS